MDLVPAIIPKGCTQNRLPAQPYDLAIRTVTTNPVTPTKPVNRPCLRFVPPKPPIRPTLSLQTFIGALDAMAVEWQVLELYWEKRAFLAFGLCCHGRCGEDSSRVDTDSEKTLEKWEKAEVRLEN